ncbi:MAG: hypothetical protein Q9216_003194 [Gyalolechia sp. 2 TL-2023]
MLSIIFALGFVALTHGVIGAVVPVQAISSGVIQRDTVNVPITIYPDDDISEEYDSTCVHTAEGFIQCGDVMSKRDVPNLSNLSKRVKMIHGYPDISGTCSPDGFHWVQKDDPGFCHEITTTDHKTEKYKQLWVYCYSHEPCDKKTLKLRKRQSGGCHGHGQDLYFQSTSFRDVCNYELVKGSVAYKKSNPGVEWNSDLMEMCFISAGCDGGDAMGEE